MSERVQHARLVVLGSCGAWPEPRRACSGYLLEVDGYRIVLDLGYGTLPRLLSHLDSHVADGLDAVVVTHRHADHAVDLHGLFRARWFGRRGSPALPLYAPAGVVTQLLAQEMDDPSAVSHVFDWRALPAAPSRVGPMWLSTWSLPHFVPSVGVRLTAPGVTVAYTGDTGPHPALAEMGRDADVYIMEASDRDQQPGVPPAPPGPARHLRSVDAAEAASRAGAQRLLLSHFWPGNDRHASGAAAARHFDGEVLLADEGLEIVLV